MAKGSDSPMVGLILGGKPKAGPKEEDDLGDPALSAAEAALEAFKSGDAAALSEALRLHYDACQHDKYEHE